MFVALRPRCDASQQVPLQQGPTVKCYGCGVLWKLPAEVKSQGESPILHPPLSSLDERVEMLLQAADEQLAPLATRQTG
jgi:hypothetical protein